MVHFPGLTRTDLCIQSAVTWFDQDGFPHSEIPGSLPACGSPRLIAACHVLLRLLAPRHPPYALSSLTTKLTQRLFSSFAPPLRLQLQIQRDPWDADPKIIVAESRQCATSFFDYLYFPFYKFF